MRIYSRIKILDSIRGIAALVVLYHHIFKLNKKIFQNNLTSTWFDIFDYVSSLNKEAVLLFFIISGFSIGLSVSKRPINTKKSLNTYIYKRLKRILPIYWISIALAFVIGFVLNILYLKDFNIINFIGNLFFLQTSASIAESWVVPYGLNGPLWSLAFEMFFYLAFPIAYILNKKYLLKTNLNVKYIVFIFIILIGIIFNKKIFFVPYFLFLAGFITWIQGYISSKYFTLWQKNNLFFITNFMIGLMSIIFHNYIPSDTLLVIGKGMFLNGIFYFSMLFFENKNFDKTQNIINKLFFKIGEGSYAIYALHYPFLIFFEMKKIDLMYQLLFIPPFIVVCYFLEKRSIQWKLKFLELNYLKPLQLLKK
ncbi:acyltransferase [Cellulophaga baltica]|uniref:acyltransferase family protein n=1 Tax=Cellulophaga TaxID=104264 RepID=UPI001C06BCBB|nr:MULTISPECIES: acyltransferase [Cellulophaga]MBU2995642.1 acyltransferase [Cellulophaga baltica]MDO6767036.1 acyltransferase [Cellulophaga sp. 1_MG-2023]